MTEKKWEPVPKFVKDEQNEHFFDLFVDGKRTNATIQVFPYSDGSVNIELGIWGKRKDEYTYRKVSFDEQ